MRKGITSLEGLTTLETPPQSTLDTTTPTWLIAVRAAESKKGTNFRVLDLRPVTSFTDTFVICEGTNPRQVQSIADEIHFEVKQKTGELPASYEGFQNGEWILMDYGDFIVHVFQPESRKFYDLERLWSAAHEVAIPPEAK